MAELESDMSEQDLLFNAYIEGDLDRGEREDFARRLETDPEFRKAWEQFERIMGGIRRLPMEFAPDDFVDRVRGRIRTRSNGRFFAENMLFNDHMPYEVVAVVMMIVMATTYLFFGAPPDSKMHDVKNVDPPPSLKSSEG
ncbi:MAG: hypothetical protein R3E66_06085 [bacterium]